MRVWRQIEARCHHRSASRPFDKLRTGIEKILKHIGLDPQPPPRTPARKRADLLFELVSRRYESKSTVVTTNKAFADWSQVFPNAACVVSLVDRLVHHSEVISIEGESYRLKEAKERSEQRTRQQRKGKS